MLYKVLIGLFVIFVLLIGFICIEYHFHNKDK